MEAAPSVLRGRNSFGIIIVLCRYKFLFTSSRCCTNFLNAGLGRKRKVVRKFISVDNLNRDIPINIIHGMTLLKAGEKLNHTATLESLIIQNNACKALNLEFSNLYKLWNKILHQPSPLFSFSTTTTTIASSLQNWLISCHLRTATPNSFISPSLVTCIVSNFQVPH